MVAGQVEVAADTAEARATSRPVRRRRLLKTIGWYVILVSISVVFILPFVWMLLTSLKGPEDPIFSVPPQFLPAHPTLDNYAKVLDTLPVFSFYRNSIVDLDRQQGTILQSRNIVIDDVQAVR